MLGIKRFHHADPLRFDPVLEEIYGVRGLPSDTTVGNYLRKFTSYDNQKLTRVVDRVTEEGLSRANPFSKDLPVNKMKKPNRRIVLDIDGTELTVYGKQEKAKRGHSKRKKDSPQYRMLSSFIAGLEWWLDYQLLPGNMSLRGHGDEMVKRAGGRLPDGWVIGGIRGDTALYNGEDIKRWNQRGRTLGISAQKTKDLKREIGAIPEGEWKRFEDEQGELICELAEIKYKPKSWDHGPYRYIVSRRKRKIKRTGKQRALFNMDPWYDYFAYITNHKGDVLSAYQFVVGRCNVENCIKESKIGFDGEEVPHKEYEANQAYLGHVQIAYNIKLAISIDMLSPQACRKRRESFVREMIKVPARLIKDGVDWIVSMPKWWPFKTEIKLVWASSIPPPVE